MCRSPVVSSVNINVPASIREKTERIVGFAIDKAGPHVRPPTVLLTLSTPRANCFATTDGSMGHMENKMRSQRCFLSRERQSKGGGSFV